MRTPFTKAVWLVAFVLAMVLAPREVAAFCRTGTRGADETCRLQGGCCTAGVPIYWQSQCVTYRIAGPPSTKRNISPTALSDAVARAFASWTRPNERCVPGIATIELAPIDGFKLGDGINSITVRDTVWDYPDPDRVLGLTTVTFEAPTGRIREADLELNTGRHPIEVENREGVFWLDAVLTHELGHFLGIADSNEPDVVMTPQYAGDAWAARAELADDDKSAICDVYPSRALRNAGSTSTPSVPCNLAATSSPCGEDTIVYGCAVGRGHVARALVPGAALTLFVALVVRRKRRR